MAVMAQWLDKTWEVSSQRITALNGLTASVKLKTETNEDKAGEPATQAKAFELQSFAFDFDVSSAAGVDVRSEYESWTALVGEIGPFLLAGKRFGPEKLMLTEVSLQDALLDDMGRILMGKIAIQLQEYAEEAAGKKAAASEESKGAGGAPGIASSGKGAQTSAAGIGAAPADKAAKKASV